jgi:serine/threonine protein phosphatase 1
MAALVKRFPANTLGRDFVVGDIHGHRHLFEQCLFKAGFNPETDRVFSVGDIIDRGPDSPACLALLDEPWFHAVRGNHEEMMISAVLSARKKHPEAKDRMAHWLKNGGVWVSDWLFTDTLEQWLYTIQNLPLVMVVGAGEGRFNVLHAEFFGSDKDLDSGKLDLHAQAAIQWGRFLINNQNHKTDSLQKGLSRTFVGHTPVANCKTIAQQFYLDTGAFMKDGKLTLLQVTAKGLEKQVVYQAENPVKIHEIRKHDSPQSHPGTTNKETLLQRVG